jgi:hypothetical protein
LWHVGNFWLQFSESQLSFLRFAYIFCSRFSTEKYNFQNHFIPLWLYSPLNLGCFLSILILNTSGGTPWTGDQPVAMLLPTHRKHKQSKHTETSNPRVGFESTTPVFQRANTGQKLIALSNVIKLYVSTRTLSGVLLNVPSQAFPRKLLF